MKIEKLLSLLLVFSLTLTACATATSPVIGANTSSQTPASTVTEISASSAPSLAAGQYYFDVAPTHWASDPINAFAAKEIYFQADLSKKMFHPSDSMTRATVVYGLAKAMGIKIDPATAKAPFEDLGQTNAECLPFIDWGYANKVVNGTSETTFNPNGDITRQDLMTILGQYLGSANLALPKTVDRPPFTDADNISEYAYGYITLMQKAGVINGYSDGNGSSSFDPKKAVSRAEATKILRDFAISAKPITEVQNPATGDKKPVAPQPTLQPTPAPQSTSDPKPSDNKYPKLSGPNVWWDESIYQETMDTAATKDHLVYKMVTSNDNVTIYLGGEWPALMYVRLIFSDSGLKSTSYTWSQQDNKWYDNGSAMGYTKDVPFARIIQISGWYDYYKDREPWRSNSPDVDYPWNN